MARLFNGTSDKAVLSAAVVTAVPLTLAAWFKQTATGAGRVIIDLSNGGTNLFQLRQTASGAVGANTNANQALSSAAATAGTWNHGCATFASITSRAAYLNGANKGTNASSTTPSGINKTTIGVKGDGTLFYNGSLADIAIWNVALADADVAMLALGISPLLVRRSALVAYWPFLGYYSPEIDLLSSTGITLTGTTQSAHPRVFGWHHQGGGSRTSAAPAGIAAANLIGGQRLIVGGTLAA